MAIAIHKSSDRGIYDHGWLKSAHSFSFAEFYNPERMGVGKLRVLNDDQVLPGAGFPPHPHADMEIISIVLEGAIAHKDTMGNSEVVPAGDVQVMSAGTGIRHSEYNPSERDWLRFLQIWVLPERRGVAPRYMQRSFPAESRAGRWQLIVAPEGHNDPSIPWIHQQAWFHRGSFVAGTQTQLPLMIPGNLRYLFVIDGDVRIGTQKLSRRDAIVLPAERVLASTESAADLLLIEVPV